MIMQTIFSLYTKDNTKKGFKIPYFHCNSCIKDSVTQEDMLMKNCSRSIKHISKE